MANSEDAIISGSLDGTIESWNRGAERLYGYTAEEILGCSVGILRPAGDLSDVSALQKRLEAGEPVSGFETREVRKDGTLIDVSVSISPLFDDHGRVTGVSSIARDISERKAAEAAVREHARRLEHLARVEADAPRSTPPSEMSSGSPGDLPPRARARIDSILSLARQQLSMEVAFVGELADGQETFSALSGDGASFGLSEGSALPLSETYCQRMVEGKIPSIVADAASEPEVSGLAVTRAGRIGAYVGVPLVLSDGSLYGALCGLGHTAQPQLSQRHVELLQFLGDLVIQALEDDQLDERERRTELEHSGMHALIAALEARDHYTSDHSKTVVELAADVAGELGLSADEKSAVEQVALLHDIGKVGIPDTVLQKAGPLSPPEWELMRQHPAIGARIVASIDSLAHLAPAVRAEHERYDGRGYPDGLAGEQIPIASRITLACDAYHAMTSDRPYRAARPAAEARRELSANAGTQFDPAVVEALLETLATAARTRVVESEAHP